MVNLQVRLWSVPERREVALADVHEVATAAAQQRKLSASRI